MEYEDNTRVSFFLAAFLLTELRLPVEVSVSVAMQLGQLVRKALWLSFWETAKVPTVRCFSDKPRCLMHSPWKHLSSEVGSKNV